MQETCSRSAHFGIRTKDYKLIFFYGVFYKDTGETANIEGWGNRYTFRTPPGWELYDLKKDPFEMDNRYNDPAYADVAAGLKNQLKDSFPHFTEHPHYQLVN